MDYRFTAVLIIMLCLLAIFGKPGQNPSLKLEMKEYILPLPKPKIND